MYFLNVFSWVFMFCMCPLSVNGGLFDWMFNSYENTPSKTSELPNFNYDGSSTDVAVSVKIPFEITSVDEKFVEDLSKFSVQPLTELDKCNHRIILGMKATCADMTEEELSKLSVNLLNCQSAVENRQIYPCTKDMRIHECTKEMDLNTWNAYHIVSNRARAACYQLRQQQFKAKTEFTVNHLMESAENQILTMNRLKESHDHLHDSTIKTMDEFSSSHKNIVGQQEQLFNAQQTLSSFVSSNIRELARERSLIASGQRELSRITQSIKKKLDEANNQLVVQDEGQKTAHERILSELLMIQNSASKVWDQLDASTAKIIETHQQTKNHYDQLLTDLKTMNTTVHHLMNMVFEMKRKVEDKFSWLSIIIGDADETLQKLYGATVHGTYLIVGMIAASFLQVPYLTRLALVLIVPLNALSELHHETSLPFVTLTAVLGGVMLCNLFTVSAFKFYHWQKEKKYVHVEHQEKPPLTYPTPQSVDNEVPDYRESTPMNFEDIERTPLDTAPRPPPRPKTIPQRNRSSSEYRDRLYNITLDSRRKIFELGQQEENASVNMSANESLDRSTSKKTCTAICKSGLPCRLGSSANSPYCHKHGGQSRESTPLL